MNSTIDVMAVHQGQDLHHSSSETLTPDELSGDSWLSKVKELNEIGYIKKWEDMIHFIESLKYASTCFHVIYILI